MRLARPSLAGSASPVSSPFAISASIWRSVSSESLLPSGPNSLMPLSWKGLCDAEIITPRSARSDRVSMATAGVGNGPNWKTSMPTEGKPATRADSLMSPESRVSLPITTRWRCSPRVKRRPAAMPTRMTISGVMGWELAGPRTPSVPKSLRVICASTPVTNAGKGGIFNNHTRALAADARQSRSRQVSGCFSQGLPDGENVLERSRFMGSEIIRTLKKGEELGGERGRAGFARPPPGQPPEEGFARHRDEQRQAEGAFQLRQPPEHGEGGFRVGTQEEAHAGIEKEAVAVDSGPLQHRQPRREEIHTAIEDLGCGNMRPRRPAPLLHRMHDD